MFAALNTFTSTILRFIMPLVGTLLADWIGIRSTLVVAAVARMLGALLFWRLGVGGASRRDQADGANKPASSPPDDVTGGARSSASSA